MIFPRQHKGFRLIPHEISYFSMGCKPSLAGSKRTRGQFEGLYPPYPVFETPIARYMEPLAYTTAFKPIDLYVLS